MKALTLLLILILIKLIYFKTFSTAYYLMEILRNTIFIFFNWFMDSSINSAKFTINIKFLNDIFQGIFKLIIYIFQLLTYIASLKSTKLLYCKYFHMYLYFRIQYQIINFIYLLYLHLNLYAQIIKKQIALKSYFIHNLQLIISTLPYRNKLHPCIAANLTLKICFNCMQMVFFIINIF